MGFLFGEQGAAGTDRPEVTGYEGGVKTLIVPEGVRSIASFAFANRTDLTRVILPESLKELHLFAFQNCTELRSIELWNTTDDYYDGVIRGCTALQQITVHCRVPDCYVIVRELLGDTDRALTFTLLDETEQGIEKSREGWTARLTFPEYVNEAREDTMARAIHFSIEGAGMAYRECVSKKAIDYAGYDRLLPRLTEYDFASAADISIGRLRFPVHLGENAKVQYEEYLRRHASRVLEMLIRRGDADSVRFITGRNLTDGSALEPALQMASAQGRTQICAILMDCSARLRGGQHRLSLDGWD